MEPQYLDRQFTLAQSERAFGLLAAAGFGVDLEDCLGAPRTIIAGIVETARRKTVAEILELVIDDDAEAA
ncbi:MAG TPA: hypothetical protein VIG51_09830 [Candidatus Baltobacteraceae bacterium]|jgi:hypothetical protein